MKKLAMLLVAAAICCGATAATAAETANKVQCTATTQAGAQCKKTAVSGTKLCTVHTPVPAAERCTATTKADTQCKHRRAAGLSTCKQHAKKK